MIILLCEVARGLVGIRIASQDHRHRLPFLKSRAASVVLSIEDVLRSPNSPRQWDRVRQGMEYRPYSPLFCYCIGRH